MNTATLIAVITGLTLIGGAAVAGWVHWDRVDAKVTHAVDAHTELPHHKGAAPIEVVQDVQRRVSRVEADVKQNAVGIAEATAILRLAHEREARRVQPQLENVRRAARAAEANARVLEEETDAGMSE